MKFGVDMLEKGLIGLVMVFALITLFGTIATPIGLAIANVTSSSLTGVAIFTVAGIVITVGVLVAILKGVMGKR